MILEIIIFLIVAWYIVSMLQVFSLYAAGIIEGNYSIAEYFAMPILAAFTLVVLPTWPFVKLYRLFRKQVLKHKRHKGKWMTNEAYKTLVEDAFAVHDKKKAETGSGYVQYNGVMMKDRDIYRQLGYKV